ncbi:hypothetical protein HMPREF9018_0994 [Prevotella amnii CRIS 21A-A]|uniref:Uncharacterized protein n=1 Tax=Prevotella amnii CRIS 21A-A TaxID=679191 RepID=E1GWF2_9BACT|nr:hypothetical protein HMPREF9018_0994 [Prevotella amnii CRIS 21A-A]
MSEVGKPIKMLIKASLEELKCILYAVKVAYNDCYEFL